MWEHSCSWVSAPEWPHVFLPRCFMSHPILRGLYSTLSVNACFWFICNVWHCVHLFWLTDYFTSSDSMMHTFFHLSVGCPKCRHSFWQFHQVYVAAVSVWQLHLLKSCLPKGIYVKGFEDRMVRFLKSQPLLMYSNITFRELVVPWLYYGQAAVSFIFDNISCVILLVINCNNNIYQYQ